MDTDAKRPAYPVRKTIYLSDEDNAAMQELAAADGMNDTTFVRGLIRREIARRAAETNGPVLHSATLDTLGA